MKKTLRKLFAGAYGGACAVGIRGIVPVLLLALVAFVPQGAQGAAYANLGGDRILLMNNDTRAANRGQVTNQGYYDTNAVSGASYWTHEPWFDNTAASTRSLLNGTHHTYRSSDGKLLWELVDCRAGSGFSDAATRNYIPCSTKYAQKSAAEFYQSSVVTVTTSSTGKVTTKTNRYYSYTNDTYACVIFQNVETARLYSPYYEWGIGTIYFDTVNAFTTSTGSGIALEIATNAVNGIDFALANNNDEDLNWQVCPFDVLTIENSRVTETRQGMTNLNLDVTSGGSTKFYRVRAHLNYRDPIRFRVRRVGVDSGKIDTAGLILIDNVVASVPPMTVVLHGYGEEYDKNLKGGEVIGRVGDFSSPFFNFHQKNVFPRAYFSYITNDCPATSKKISVSKPTLNYRWRYLNQDVRGWRTISFTANDITQLVSNVALNLEDGVGDLEYFTSVSVNAPFYQATDYAFDSAVGFGHIPGGTASWTENISSVTNRGSITSPEIYNENNLTPACGTDYFVRIREAESEYEWIKLITSVTTNGTEGVKLEEIRMELVNTNTWRYCYYVPTNAVGETLRFHFTGKRLFADPENPFAYAAETNSWKCDLSRVPYLPYTSVAGTQYVHDVALTLDKASTHVMIEFNDQLLTYSVSHGTHQDFNTWTDAINGYHGNAQWDGTNPTNGEAAVEGASATGVSDTKKKFDADFVDWEVQGYTDPFWQENFNSDDRELFPLYTPFDTAISAQNGWDVGHGQWIGGVRGTATSAAAAEEVTLQLEGRGQGYVALDKDSNMPRGIGSVKFGARVAQEPRFDDFAVYADGVADKDYAISAKLTMSRKHDTSSNPDDISPARPSVSLVGYWRPKKGCYEFRITRTSSTQLTCALYKWTPGSAGMVSTMLASNVVSSANSSSEAKPGPGQTSVYNLNNLLVPGGSGDINFATGTSAYMFLFNTQASSESPVRIECKLCSKRTKFEINSQDDKNNLKPVLTYTDSDHAHQKGTYGVGSTDCHAAFGTISRHAPAIAGSFDGGINYAGVPETDHITAGDWAYFAERWAQWTGTVWGNGTLTAVIPTNQTIRLQFKDDANGWFDSGYEQQITSFSTNRFEFAPHVAQDYKVRLISGGHTWDEVRTDVAVDDIEIEAWRAGDSPTLDLAGTHAGAEEWVYTAATLESAADIKGPATPEVVGASTNGFAFIFKTPGVYTVVPEMDLIVDKVLLVGGGGAGGWTIGAGGGGGGVFERDFSTNTVLIKKGAKVSITVGGGGDNFYKADNGSGNWKRGGNGGDSRIIFTDANTSHPYDDTAKGGGGGGAWSNGNTGNSGGSGGGSAHGGSGTAGGTRVEGGGANQPAPGHGFKGGAGVGGVPGGGGGAGAPGEDAHATAGQNVTVNEPANGGDGWPSDITGAVVYYGGGGGAGSGSGDTSPKILVGGSGGRGGGGDGCDAASKVLAGNGVNGLGGGGGGGSHGGSAGTNAGGKGGSGCVILRVRNASKVCTLQPARGTTDEAMGLRSPYLEYGIGMFSFTYVNANSNCVLLLQACLGTNGVDSIINGTGSMSKSLTQAPPDDSRWTTLTNFTFKGLSAQDLASGSCSYFTSLRHPVHGFLRLVVATNVMQYCEENEGPGRDVDYGKITITKIYAYDEPALDLRSWWGWNMHTEGWNTDDKQYAYLFDSPNGLSASLNFSAQKRENELNLPDTRGIGLSDPDLAKEYEANNSYVQSPPLTNGIGTVTFRARTFTTNQTYASYVTLWGTSEPDSYQVQVPDAWQKLSVFKITNTTYQTYSWATTDDSTKIYAIRLSVDASRHGRSPSSSALSDWERNYDPPYPPTQLQRVWVDEITASEPIAPRVVLRDVRPFRSHLADDPPATVTNVTDLSEQPILGESWGLQVTVEPQQMSDELVTTSVVVYAAFYNGVVPWGYQNWSNKVTAVRLEQVAENLVFRSTYNNAASIIGPDMTPESAFPLNVWQYHVWAEYYDKSGVFHVHNLDSTEWQPPTWYYGIKDLNEKYGGGVAENFSGYTILDSISPERAWLNEVNVCDDGSQDDGKRQFIEIAVPQGADLTDWRIDLLDRNQKRGTIARFGSGNAKITSKTGGTPGVDAVNHYTFVSLRSPGANAAGNIPEADGAWLSAPTEMEGYKNQHKSLQLNNGDLNFYEAYGIELVRPSGVIEHQIVVAGTNYYAGGPLEYLTSGTNLVNAVKKIDGEASHWFYAGEDAAYGTLGVWRSHGENIDCWTNKMLKSAANVQSGTPGALNQMADGTLQDIDPAWFLQPNGTNVWIYASVIGMHVDQKVGVNTNGNIVLVIRKGGSTNVIYTTDAWYHIAEVTTNGQPVAEAVGRANRNEGHTWTLWLNNVEETLNVTVKAERSADLEVAGLDPTDPYYDAIMAWLAQFDDSQGLKMAEQWDLAGTKVADLDIKDMYWLDINPVEGDWVLQAGMGTIDGRTLASAQPTPQSVGTPPAPVAPGPSLQAVAPTPYNNEGEMLTNVQMYVTMKIRKRNGSQAHAPDHLLGIEPGSSSYDYDGSENWGSANFKICGALQKDGVKGDFYPLRWFVFGPGSFDENFRAKIEVKDPHSTSSPGFYNGWHDFPEIPIFYKWRIDAEPAYYSTVELLKSDSTYQ